MTAPFEGGRGVPAREYDVLPPLERIVGDHTQLAGVANEIVGLVRRAYYAREDAHPEGIVVRVFVSDRTGGE